MQMMIDLRKDLVQELDEKFYNGRGDDEDYKSKLAMQISKPVSKTSQQAL